MRNPILWAVAAALLLLPVAASAQATGDVTATATVLTPLSVNGVDDLEFGDVLPGVATTVLPTDLSAGLYDVAGEGDSEIDIGFTLPTDLVGPASATMPISFGNNSAAHSDGGVPQFFDPNTGTNADLSGGALQVFIGGTVTPAFDQAPGSYSSIVTMTVAYTGN